MSTSLFFTVWLVCALINYFLTRFNYRTTFDTWTQSDRVLCAGCSLLGGPGALVIQAIFFVIAKVGATEWGKRGARW